MPATMAEREDQDGGIATRTKTRTREKVAKPRMHRVVLHNDDYTTREFVVDVLRGVFHRSEAEAVAIMLHVHRSGTGVAGVYTYEVAETKVRQVESLARAREFPLMLTIEPDEEERDDG
jgi:ATP-dependent Clp protease adaptor protein ClpS